MKICLLGAGALGSTFGGTLAEAGNEVYLVDVYKPFVEEVNEKGLIFADEPDTVVKVPAFENTKSLGVFDLVIVLVKSFATREAVESAKNIIGDRTVVMSLQNGFGNEDTIADVIGADKVVSGKTYVGGGVLGVGYVRRTVKNKMTYIGELTGEKTERIQKIADVLNNAGMATEVAGNIMGLIWDKLLVNAATGALTAITRLTYGPIYQDEAIPEIKQVGLAVIQEGIDVARTKGIQLKTEDVEKIWYSAAENLPYEFKTSMFQSFERKMRTEIDYFNGAIAREGDKLGVPTPVNKTLVACVKGIEYAMFEK